MVFIFIFGDFITRPSHKCIFFNSQTKVGCQMRNRQSQLALDLYTFHVIRMFLCSNCCQKRASTKVIEAMFYTGGTEHSVLLWEGSAALTVVKRDEREGV